MSFSGLPRLRFAPTTGLMALTLGLMACQPVTVPGSGGGEHTQPASAVGVLLTTGDQSRLLSTESSAHFSRDGGETYPTVTVDTTRTDQQMDGVGAALTDASAWLIQNKLSADARTSLLRDLFGTAGAGLDGLRLPMGASDFALTHYSYDDVPAGQTDPTLAHFSVEHDRAYILPVAQQARQINPGLKFMASPWSAPGWMKTTDSLIKGKLKPENYPVYAQYFRRFIEAYAQAGVPIDPVTVQNEPHAEPDNYPGMRVEAGEAAAFIRDHLGPTLRQAGLNTKIIGWDHNWDEWTYPLELLQDAGASRDLDGTAFHCYGGDVDAQSQVHDTFPGKNLYFTECSGGYWADNFADNLKWNTQNLLIGAPRNWAKTVLLWNLALDGNHGPHTGGCGDCRGVVTIHQDTGKVDRNVEYYVLAQYGRAVRPGAYRVSSATYNADAGTLQSVAFRNPDGSKALIVLNTASSPLTFKVKENGSSFYTTLPAASVATYTWTGMGSDAPAPTAPPLDAYTRIEAENYSAVQGIQTESSSDEGGAATWATRMGETTSPFNAWTSAQAKGRAWTSGWRAVPRGEPSNSISTRRTVPCSLPLPLQARAAGRPGRRCAQISRRPQRAFRRSTPCSATAA